MPENQGEISITRGRFDSLILYEVTSDELALLEKGPDSSIYQNFTIALFSLCVPTTLSIFATTFPNDTVFIIFLVVALVTFILGLLTAILWFRSSSAYSEIIKKIKSRTEKKSIVPSDVDSIVLKDGD